MPSKKKMKLEPKSAKSRLMQICDSSSDEEETRQKESKMSVVEDEVPVKKEKENKTPSPKKNQITRGNDTNGNSSTGKRRAKVKKMVTRTYEDEDGFISKCNTITSHTRSILKDFIFSHCRYCTGNGSGQLFRRRVRACSG